MPIYEYRCTDCTRGFEVLTSFAERDRAQVCPRCESIRTRVLVSSFASFGGVAEAGQPLNFGGAPKAAGGCCGGSCGCGH